MEQKAIKCMEIDQTLLYKQLPAHMIVTNFIGLHDMGLVAVRND